MPFLYSVAWSPNFEKVVGSDNPADLMAKYHGGGDVIKLLSRCGCKLDTAGKGVFDPCLLLAQQKSVGK